MAVRKVKYSREFMTETNKKDDSYHGSPEWVPYQDACKEDMAIRDNAIDRFAGESLNMPSRFYGSDGKQQYIFQITSPPPLHKPENPEEHFQYTTTFRITKMGDDKGLDNLSDLEQFLLENKFQGNQ